MDEDIGNGIYSYVENVTNGHDLVDANADDDSDIDDAGSEEVHHAVSFRCLIRSLDRWICRQ